MLEVEKDLDMNKFPRNIGFIVTGEKTSVLVVKDESPHNPFRQKYLGILEGIITK